MHLYDKDWDELEELERDLRTPSQVKIEGKWVDFDFCADSIDAYDDEERFPRFKNRVYLWQGSEFKYGVC